LLGHTQSTALPEKSNQNTTLYKKNKNWEWLKWPDQRLGNVWK
jgi:hypothetical protein